MKAKEGLITLAVVLGVLLIGAIIWGSVQSSKKNQLLSQNELMSSDLGELTELKANLEKEVDSLKQEYFAVAEENETLSGSLSEAQTRMADLEKALKSEKGKSSSQVNNLRAQIEELIAVKTELQGAIAAVQAENDSLKMVTGILTQDLNVAREENQALANLNQTIQEEVKRLTLANFKASAFRVDTEQRNDKVSTKAKRIREINVSFDLTNVPAEYQGVRPLYLTVTDDKGVPINVANPIRTKVVVNDQAMDLIAVKSKDVNVGDNQRLSFNYELEDKLKPGFYRASVYTDVGLLGASSFQLR
jgi:hypothetical protein